MAVDLKTPLSNGDYFIQKVSSLQSKLHYINPQQQKENMNCLGICEKTQEILSSLQSKIDKFKYSESKCLVELQLQMKKLVNSQELNRASRQTQLKKSEQCLKNVEVVTQDLLSRLKAQMKQNQFDAATKVQTLIDRIKHRQVNSKQNSIAKVQAARQLLNEDIAEVKQEVHTAIEQQQQNFKSLINGLSRQLKEAGKKFNEGRWLRKQSQEGLERRIKQLGEQLSLMIERQREQRQHYQEVIYRLAQKTCQRIYSSTVSKC